MRVERRALLAAALVAALAFALYRSTLLPGFDFGDTGSFQATVGSPLITPRDGYPLYLAVGWAILATTGGDPAHALNLASAVESALACGILLLAALELSGSIAAALAASLLFMGSYTFWSQSIIAEVYALHMIFVAATIWLALRWSSEPTTARLAAFFAVYALGFGNHLSMILLMPAFAAFLIASAPGGWRSMLAPRIVGLALACAAAGACQYIWNIRALWLLPNPPAGILEALQRFWFDVTKTDWRETMVLQVPRALLADHAAMYAFDLRQQYGWIVPGLALVGVAELGRRHWRRALLVVAAYLVNALFAFSYNVGDTHVFYLPSHLVVALAAAVGIATVGRAVRQPAVVSSLVMLYAGARVYRDYPALDRSADRRPADVLAAFTRGLDDLSDVLVTDLNWQVQNGLSYFTKETRPEISSLRMPPVLLYLPALASDNAAIGRTLAASDRAANEARAAYGPLLPIEADPRVAVQSLAAAAARTPDRAAYALCLLKPTRELALDTTDLQAAVRLLTGGHALAIPAGDYVAIVGTRGQPPALMIGSDRPFDTSVTVGGIDVEVRMDSWLSADTIRRMGFGHVIAARHHTLIVERGVSFATFGSDGVPLETAYAANIFAPQRRYLIRAPSPR